MWRMRVAICSRLHELSILLWVVFHQHTCISKTCQYATNDAIYVLAFGRWVWKPHNLPYRKQLHGSKSWGQGGLNGSEHALMQDYPNINWKPK